MIKVYVIKNACPICGGDVKGNPVVDYYCKHCNIKFKFGDLYIYDLKKQLLEEIKPKDTKTPTYKEDSRKVMRIGLKREKGWLYFIDKDGDIARAPMNRKGRKKSKENDSKKTKN